MRDAEADSEDSMVAYFPSFSEGLSLRDQENHDCTQHRFDFPSFSEGLSLRGAAGSAEEPAGTISLPFRRDFH